MTKLASLQVVMIVAFSLNARADPRRHFSVADDIGITQFGDIYTGKTEAVTYSPDGRLVVVHTERGSLEDDRLHDELRFYSMDELRAFIDSSDSKALPPNPLWIVAESTSKNGDDSPLVKEVQWLSDSRGVAFLLRNERGYDQLVLADLDQKAVRNLSPETLAVTNFAIHDRTHYVFTVRNASIANVTSSTTAAPAEVITGRELAAILFPERLFRFGDYPTALWFSNNAPVAPVRNRASGNVVTIYGDGRAALSLSPDGRSLLTLLPVEYIPKEWEKKYPPPYPEYPYHVRAGPQDLNSPPQVGSGYVSEYAIVDLESGSVASLPGALDALRTGWSAASASASSWSDDGKKVLLGGTYLSSEEEPQHRPCIAVVAVRSGEGECVVALRHQLAAGYEPGFEAFRQASFVVGRSDEVVLKYWRLPEGRAGYETYLRTGAKSWRLESDTHDLSSTGRPVEVRVKVTFKDPPVLVAESSGTHTSKEIYDPNPQLKDIEFGDASVYLWTDATGREWKGILYKPPGYTPGKHYPFVVQNHGFLEARFSPSGIFPTVFAAQELASAGIVVLQVRDCAGNLSPDEGPCNVRGYESAVRQLTKEGLIDPNDVGISGFSRTVFYVMKALTTSHLHYQAATIADGVNLGYWQHLLEVGKGSFEGEDLSMIGALPIGHGLEKWLMNSPEFNIDKISTPLRIVGHGRASVLFMWEPYALLRQAKKPVEFVELNSDEHILTNPAVRLASQGETVDWYRFWLQGYEDSDPEKGEQYVRWEKLCDMQKSQNPDHPTFCVGAKH